MSLKATELTTFYVYLTSGCNCSCCHCWIVSEQAAADTNQKMLDLELFRQAIKQALPLGLNSVKWTGGEPTLHPGFCDFLKLQQEFGLQGAVETNGMLVDDRLAEQMQMTGVVGVSVSLDGALAETHDAIRGVDGGFLRTLRGIRSLVKTGYRPELILTLQRLNRAELQDYMALAQELGVGSVKLNLLQPVLRGANLYETGGHLEIGEILEVSASLKEQSWAQNGIPVYMDLPMAFRPLSKMLSGEQDGACKILNIMGVLPRGDYALCGIGQHVAELSMGSINDQLLAEIWQSHPVLLRLRAGLPEGLQGVCHSCLMRSICQGSCVAANFHLSDDLLAPYWFCQQAADLGLFPEQRQIVRDSCE